MRPAMISRVEKTDHELLRAYAELRDVASLGAFVSRYQGSLVRFAARLVRDPETAQEVVQETFLDVARHPRRPLGVESCHNWLLKVAGRAAASRLSHGAGAGARTSGLSSVEEGGAPADGAGLLPARVRAGVDRLSPLCREVLHLKIEEAKSFREIAEITGLTVTNVAFLLHRALKELGASLNHVPQEPSLEVSS